MPDSPKFVGPTPPPRTRRRGAAITNETWAKARELYEKTTKPVSSIALELGIGSPSIKKMADKKGWIRLDRKTREMLVQKKGCELVGSELALVANKALSNIPAKEISDEALVVRAIISRQRNEWVPLQDMVMQGVSGVKIGENGKAETLADEQRHDMVVLAEKAAKALATIHTQQRKLYGLADILDAPKAPEKHGSLSPELQAMLDEVRKRGGIVEAALRITGANDGPVPIEATVCR